MMQPISEELQVSTICPNKKEDIKPHVSTSCSIQKEWEHRSASQAAEEAHT
jgi:hypothetical protein